MEVGSIAQRDVVSAKPEATVRDAILTLEGLDVRHLPIVTEEGELVGMISDRDLREYRLPILEELDDPAKADDLLDTPLSQLMSGNVVSIDSFESLRTAVDLMIEYGVGALPVMDPDREELVGILSYVDVLRAVKDSL
jgi:acetoin utilization protein AcuB